MDTIAFGKEGRGDGEFMNAVDVCTDEENRIYVVDMGSHRIQVFNVDGSFLHKFGQFGSQDGQFADPVAICTGSGEHRDCLVIADSYNNRVQIVKRNGDHVRSIPCGGYTYGVGVDSSNHIFVSMEYSIIVFDWGGEYLFAFGSRENRHRHFWFTAHLCIDTKQGVLFASDYETNMINVFDLNGSFVGLSNQEGRSTANKLARPPSVCLDSRGNVIIADTDRHRLSAWSWCKGKSSRLGVYGFRGMHPGEFSFPYGVCTDSLGRIIVTDTYNNRIQVVKRKKTSQVAMTCSLFMG
jgi:DNA-binding beta-propeller fold protein YncE